MQWEEPAARKTGAAKNTTTDCKQKVIGSKKMRPHKLLALVQCSAALVVTRVAGQHNHHYLGNNLLQQDLFPLQNFNDLLQTSK